MKKENPSVFLLGEELPEIFSKYFIGQAYLQPLTDSWFSHLAVEIPAEGASNEWLESVEDEQYNQL